MSVFWKRIDRFPPVLVRLLARHRSGPPLSDPEIAAAAGLNPYQVQAISHCTSWAGIDLPTMRKFMAGCGINLLDWRAMKRIDAYLAAPKWSYLRRSPDWHTVYQPLIELWLKSQSSKLASIPH